MLLLACHHGFDCCSKDERVFSIAMIRRVFSIDMVDSHLQNKLKVVISMGWSLVRINSCDPVSLHSEMCRDLYTNC